jgi:hypothetical protein
MKLKIDTFLAGILFLFSMKKFQRNAANIPLCFKQEECTSSLKNKTNLDKESIRTLINTISPQLSSLRGLGPSLTDRGGVRQSPSAATLLKTGPPQN